MGGSLQVRLTRVPILILPPAGCVSSGKWLSLSESGFLLCCRYLMAVREDSVGEVKDVSGAWPSGRSPGDASPLLHPSVNSGTS